MGWDLLLPSSAFGFLSPLLSSYPYYAAAAAVLHGKVRELLRAGADVNAKSYLTAHKATALYFACKANRADVVDQLLQAGASVNARLTTGWHSVGSWHGWPPLLHLAPSAFITSVSVCLSACLPACLSVCLSVCLP